MNEQLLTRQPIPALEPAIWRISTTMFIAGAAAFAIVAIGVILAQASYIPYWDQWDWYRRYFLPNETGSTLTFGLHNGHFMAVTSLIYNADLALLGASNYLEVATTIAAVIAVALLLRSVIANAPGAIGARTASVYFGTALLLLLWLFNWENLLWPFQVHAYLVVLFSVAATRFMGRAVMHPLPRQRDLAIAVLLGLLAVGSSGGGLAFWAGAMALIILGSWSLRAKALGIALIAAGMLVASQVMLAHGMRAPGPVEVRSLVVFVIEVLGSPAFFGGNYRVLSADVQNLVWAVGLGYLGLVIAGVATVATVRVRLRRPLNEAELFFLGLAVFALSGALLAALARVTGGLPSPGLASRYGVFCVLFWLSVAGLFLTLGAPSAGTVRKMEAVLPMALLVIVSASQEKYVRWWLEHRNNIDWAASSLVSHVSDVEQLAQIFPRERTDTLETVTAQLVERKISPLYAARHAVMGRPVGDLAPAKSSCADAVVRQQPVRGGVRLDGTLRNERAPFGLRRVLIANDTGTVIGVGALEHRLPWAPRGDVRWVAYAPIPALQGTTRVYVEQSDGLCSLTLAAST